MNLKYHRPRLSGHRLFVPQLQRKVRRLEMKEMWEVEAKGMGILRSVFE